MLAAATMLLLAVLMAYVLGWANRAFHVEVDPRVEKINEALPGANCGGCGYPNCNEYAEAVVAGEAAPNRCAVGGVSCAAAIADILGIKLEETWPHRPIVHCRAKNGDKLGMNPYRGEKTCSAANVISGVQACTYGCLGLGDCERACDFDAIHVTDGLATVDYEKCTGCGACERACPRNIISMVPFKTDKMLAITCSNKDPAKEVKAVCKVGCTGCGLCAKMAEMISMEGKIPSINYDKYDTSKLDDVEKAVEKCPAKALVFIGRPTEEDKAAVADEESPAVAQADFKTTADQAEWRG